jgi:hypothetical protein
VTIRNADPIEWGGLVPDSQGLKLSAEVLRETWDLVGSLGSEVKAAKKLGISRSGVHYRIQRYRNLIGVDTEIKPRKKAPNNDRDIARCAAAWDAWGQYGNGRIAAERLQLGYDAFRSRIERHRDYTGISRYAEPAGLEAHRIKRYTLAWEAWREHGSQVAAAKALGVGRSTILEHVNAHRRYNQLDARATPWDEAAA